jgi:hypothetical protein
MRKTNFAEFAHGSAIQPTSFRDITQIAFLIKYRFGSDHFSAKPAKDSIFATWSRKAIGQMKS